MKKLIIGLTILANFSTYAATADEPQVYYNVAETGAEVLGAQKFDLEGFKVEPSCEQAITDLMELSVQTGYFGKDKKLNLALLNVEDSELTDAGFTQKRLIKVTLDKKRIAIKACAQ
jgi:hypothetical protein